MKIAIEGCCHGELDKIYGALQRLEEKENIKIDLLICCGDFQAIRNEDDLECISMPVKYREMGTFYKYYSGEIEAPYLTIFIGGNHEASNYLWELYHGGWVAPKIFYMGHSGVVKVGDLRIGGLSGIFKSGDYRRGFYERPPYRKGDEKSAYHVRDFDVFKLSQVKEHIDVFLSHDWPRGIAMHGDTQRLIRDKPFFKEEVETNTLGSIPGERLLHNLKPSYWFSAHLHVKFAALVEHSGGGSTRFLALDKCLPRRDFLQVVDLPDKQAGPLAYDEEWLAIVRATHGMMPVRNDGASLPEFRTQLSPSVVAAHREFVSRRLSLRGALVPDSFSPSAVPHSPGAPRRGVMPQGVFRNPQMLALMNLLDLEYKLDAFQGPLPGPPPGMGGGGGGGGRGQGFPSSSTAAGPFGALGGRGGQQPGAAAPPAASSAAAAVAGPSENPEEVNLDDDDADGVYDDDAVAAGGGQGGLGEAGGLLVGGGGGAAAGGGRGMTKNAEEIDLGDDDL